MRYLLLFLVAATGSLLLIYDQPLLEWLDSQRTNKNQSAVGRVEQVSGTVLIRLPQSLKKDGLKAGQIWPHQAVIETKEAAEAVLTLNTGTRLKLPGNSQVAAEAAGNNVILTILEGTIEALEPGSEELLQIYQNGERITLHSLTTEMRPLVIQVQTQTISKVVPPVSAETSTIAATVNEETPTATPVPTPPRKLPPFVGSTHTTLSSEEIANSIRMQTPYIKRCYLNYLTRTQDTASKISMILAFTIQPEGKVTNAKVLQPQAGDDHLKRCVVDVIGRTRFKAFNGTPIETEYPIVFE